MDLWVWLMFGAGACSSAVILQVVAANFIIPRWEERRSKVTMHGYLQEEYYLSNDIDITEMDWFELDDYYLELCESMDELVINSSTPELNDDLKYLRNRLVEVKAERSKRIG